MKKLTQKFKLIPLYGIFIPVFGLAAFDKFSGPVPPWFLKQFEGTFLAGGPGGLAPPYYFIATLEALTALLFLASLAQVEFLPQKNKTLLQGALFLALVTFAILSFGLRLSHDFNGSFQLFGYFALTFLIEQKIASAEVQKVSYARSVEAND